MGVTNTDTKIKNLPILGTYEGECADANITNKNGLDITREVWEYTFNSEDYKQGIELGWFIGYLGHPEDPGCMDFKDACIVMTEGHIDENGKVYGKFNLIDTPVGKIVKAFQDAGVTFGISVRGAGDILNNSVDPESFVFRGFDLVTFPAFPEAIPTFSEIAASTDVNKQQRYKIVCNAVNANMKSINSTEALDIIQSQFAAQSDEYKALDERKSELVDSNTSESSEPNTQDEINFTKQQLAGVMELYLTELAANKELMLENEALKSNLANVDIRCNRKLKSIERITSSQVNKLQSELDNINNSYRTSITANRRLKAENTKLYDEVERNKKTIEANSNLISTKNSDIKKLNEKNLKYLRQIDASTNNIKNKDSIISKLRSELSETVTSCEATKQQTSNLDDTIKKLKSDVEAATKLLSEYQQSYADLYANALGISLDNLAITANTSVKDLQSLIVGNSNVNMSNVFVEPNIVDVVDEDTEDSLVTL